jgi:membrane protein YdbS with pleckstrin-like domain
MSQNPASAGQQPPHSDLEDRAPHREADDREEVYYEGSPMVRGQIAKVILWALIGLIFLASPILWMTFQKDHHWPSPWWINVVLVVIGLLFFIIPVMIVKSVRYRISNYRIDFERGIFGKKIDTLELWHVEDIHFEQSFLDRILGVGNITVVSHDDTTPRLVMIGIPNPRPLFETLKQRVIAVKRQRGVVKMDVGGHGDAAIST